MSDLKQNHSVIVASINFYLMLNLQSFSLVKSSSYDLIGIITRSAWQGYKLKILVAPRDLSQMLSSYKFRSELFGHDPVSMIRHFYKN